MIVSGINKHFFYYKNKVIITGNINMSHGSHMVMSILKK